MRARPRSGGTRSVRAVVVAAMGLLMVACGRKGPPLAPLVRLPAAPADLSGERRGDTVRLQFTVPTTNGDNTRPANVARIDVYAFTGPPGVADAELFELGTRVGSVAVKSPRDPENAVNADEPEEEAEPLEGDGLDQGAVARLDETLSAASRAGRQPAAPPARARRAPPAGPFPHDLALPLVGPPPSPEMARTYIGVGVTAKGRKGQVSRRVVVPLVAPPEAPAGAEATYTETAVSLRWGRSRSDAPVQPAASDDRLASRPAGMALPQVAYRVYETPPPAAAGEPDTGPRADAEDTRLTPMPVAGTAFTDSRMTWGTTRCYRVRTVRLLAGLAVEGEPTPPACVTLEDTFPPSAPRGLNAVASEGGAISLIWDASAERDLDGYLILRAVAPGPPLAPITPAPIRETMFSDRVPPGARYVYALVAVDTAGNASLPSARVEETAR